MSTGDDDLKRLGQILREARDASGLSLRDVGERLDTDHAYVSRVERGLKKPSKEYSASRPYGQSESWDVVTCDQTAHFLDGFG